MEEIFGNAKALKFTTSEEGVKNLVAQGWSINRVFLVGRLRYTLLVLEGTPPPRDRSVKKLLRTHKVPIVATTVLVALIEGILRSL